MAGLVACTQLDVAYLDHNASSPIPRTFLEEFTELARLAAASPSSLHELGRKSRRLINEATTEMAKRLEVTPEGIVWTSGAAEANAWVVHSVVAAAKAAGRSPRLLISSIEHDSLRLAALAAKKIGALVEWIPARADGTIDVDVLTTMLESSPADLVSVMHANNETGVIQPLERVSALCRTRQAPLHSDCVQTLGKIPVSFGVLGLSFATFSGHKLGAPKGIGFLAASPDAMKLLSALIPGPQQRGLRGGTENALGAAAFERLLAQRLATYGTNQRLAGWRADFERELKNRIPGTVIHGEASDRVCNTTFVGFKNVGRIGAVGLLAALDLAGVCASSGSACSSGVSEPSHVLKAMGCDEALARSSVRFSAGPETTWADYEKALDVLRKVVEKARLS